VVWLERYSHAKQWAGKLRYLIGLGLVVAIALFNQENTYNLVKTLFLVICVALLILSLQIKSNKLLSGNTLVLIGMISYPLYLWYYPLLVLLISLEYQ